MQAFWEKVSLDLMSREIETLKFGMKLDEYWVASFFVQLPENMSQAPRILLVGFSAIAGIAAIALLALATSARAETTTVAPAPPVSASGTPAPAPVAAPAPVEQTQPEAAVESALAAPESQATDEVASASESDGVTGEIGSPAPQTDAIADLSEPEPPSSASADQAATRLAEAGRDVAKVDATPVALVTRTAAAPQAIPASTPGRLRPTTPEALRPAQEIETLRDTTGFKQLFGLVKEASVDGALAELVGSLESLALGPEAGAPFATTPAASTPFGARVSFPQEIRQLVGKPLAGTPEVDTTGLLAEDRAGSAAAEPSRFGALGGEEGVGGAAQLGPMTPWSGADGFERSSEHSNEPAPPEAPSRSPGESFGAVGSPGSSFVPFVALLALLALVAPAISRRLREAPGFRALTPFVCALERPG
jgi:hypothetical protein